MHLEILGRRFAIFGVWDVAFINQTKVLPLFGFCCRFAIFLANRPFENSCVRHFV
jgi:hypothetical protein